MAELVAALDVSSAPLALELANELNGAVSWLKVGLELFISAGPPLVDKLAALGFSIFLDLKFYDIPATVAGAVAAAGALNVKMLTLHCQGGEEMCKAAIEASSPGQLLLGVTALTSFSDGKMPGITSPAADFARSLAGLAHGWGLGGVVCSAQEARDIKQLYPGLVCVCPGIRPAGSQDNDQARVATPAEAVQAGADFLVCGRPIIRAQNPRQAAIEILARMGQV